MAITDDAGVRDMLTGKLKNPDLGSRKVARSISRLVLTISGATRAGTGWTGPSTTKDWYDERVTDKATGDVVCDCHERLSEHWGRGSAKEPPQNR